MNSRSSRSLQTVVISLLIIGVLLLALSGFLSPLFNVTLSPLVTVQTWLSERYQALNDFLTAPRDAALLRQENSRLETENARLQAQILDLQQQIGEVQVLTALLDFARANPQNEYLAATVIGRDPSPFLHYVIINRGSDDGLRRGMPVVTDQGLVGRVAAVTADAARVQLITDPAMQVNVTIQPSKAEAVLAGSLTGDISMDMIPQDAGIATGDLVLTSGLGGNYVPNILVGQVTGIRQRDFDLFQQASVQPVVDFSDLRIVLVITNFQPIDFSPLIPTPQPGGP
ncbi:MAG: rod shape-determining protein MreC [Anaerolineales bacterium]|jgi:rod shape-determining protein MreC